MGDRQREAPDACVAMPCVECESGIYEIDEFDCASCFLVEGTERALLIDTGVGIGDLRWLVENRLAGKPYEVIATHKHGDHIGGAGWFDNIWIHPADADWENDDTQPSLSFRRDYAKLIRSREGKQYPYDPEKDIRPWPKAPSFRALSDGQCFDLGGRTVTAYHCPGHTPGEIVLVDSLTKTLLCGDACNCNWLLSGDLDPSMRGCVEKALWALKRLMSMGDKGYDPKKVFNFHHDFRPFGHPLAPEVMTDLAAGLEAMLQGTAVYEEVPDSLSSTGALKTIARSGSVMISCMQRNIREDMARRA